MRIEKIFFTDNNNFFCIDELCFNNLNIFIGNNGTGKTMLLTELNNWFSDKSAKSFYTSKYISKIELYFDYFDYFDYVLKYHC